MVLKTEYNLGDTIYPVGRVYSTDKFTVRAPMPVSLIAIEIDLGPRGLPRKSEIYGCEETAELYTLDDVFPTRGEAQAYAERLNKELSK